MHGISITIKIIMYWFWHVIPFSFIQFLSSFLQEKEHILSKLGGELLKSSFDKVSVQYCTYH